MKSTGNNNQNLGFPQGVRSEFRLYMMLAG